MFREDLVRHPRNARALFGLKESLTHRRKTPPGSSSAFDAAWSQADVS